MSLRLMSPLPARIIQVLQDYLPAELDLIDAEENDGLTTPNIPTTPPCWFAWNKPLLVEFPACTVETVGSAPLDVKPDGFGRRLDVRHRLNLRFSASTNVVAGASPLNLQKVLHRYVNGAIRVLCLMHEGLDTVADPVDFGSPNATTLCEWVEEAIYGPEAEQEGGAIVRTAMLPVRVRRIEAR